MEKRLLQGKKRSEHPKTGVRLVFERKAKVYTTTSERRDSSDKTGREPQVTWARVHW